MKALLLEKVDSPAVHRLAEVPDPVPAAGEALIRVHACGLNRLDLWAETSSLPVSIPCIWLMA